MEINKIVLHDVDQHNRVNTLTDTSIVVIEYNNKPDSYSELISMTVGKYYLARRITVEGQRKYQLLSHNNFDRKGSEHITVNATGNRFIEYPIVKYTAYHNFNLINDTLLPVFYDDEDRMKLLNIFTGNLILAESIYMYFNCGTRPKVLNELTNMLRNHYKVFVDYLITKQNECPSLPISGYSINLKKSHIEIQGGASMYNEYDTIIQLTRKILQDHPKQKKYCTDLNCGMNENYLLLN